MTPSQLRSVISQNIRELRKRLGLNQIALAEACESTQATISRIEKGVVGCDDAMLAKLGEALRVHPATLMMAAEPHVSEKPKHRNLKIGA